MDSRNDLDGLEMQLERDLGMLKGEVERVSRELKTVQEAKKLLSRMAGQQKTPEMRIYRNMGPTEIVLRVVNSPEGRWSIADIMKAARAGGKDISKWPKPDNVLRGAADRQVKKGVLRIIKDSSERGAPVFYTRTGPVQEEEELL
jgi:hypothetical protein